jgi:ribosomal protein S18 acetylase RimI-like enzyme
MIEVKEVNDKKEIKKFIDFPHDLYLGDPNYVPEIFLGQKELMDSKKNPFFKHSKATLFLARKEGKIVGRIAAIRNNNYNKYIQANVGFFGFFDCVNDYEVAKVLFEKAVEWIKNEGLDKILGPTNFTTNDTAGMLTMGFDSPPLVMMTYNKPYYNDFAEKFGFYKQMDLLAYWLPTKDVSNRSVELAQRLEERLNRKGIILRQVSIKHFKTEVDKLREVYNKAWEKNWGFVPSTKEEFEHTAEGMKMILNTDFAYLAEKDGEAVGFGLSLPDINEIMLKVKRGRLLPFGIFKLLFGKKKVKKVRIITLGVIPEFRNMGIEGILYSKMILGARKYNLEGGEASWILENNQMMIKGLENLNAKHYKTYRIYQKDI